MKRSSVFLVVALCGAVFFQVPALHAQGLLEWERYEEITTRDFETVWSGVGVTAVKLKSGLVLLSNDAEQTWSAITDFSPVELFIGDAGTVAALTTESDFMFSSDFGQTFSKVEEVSFQEGESVFFGNRDNLFARHVVDGQTDQYYRSENGGRTWSTIAAFPESLPLQKISVDYIAGFDGVCYVFDKRSIPMIYQYNPTTDQWEPGTIVPDGVHDLRFGGDGRIYAQTNLGGNRSIYRTALGTTNFQLLPFDLGVSPYGNIEIGRAGEIYAMDINAEQEAVVTKIAPDGRASEELPPVPLGHAGLEHFVDNSDNLWLEISLKGWYRYAAESDSWKLLELQGYPEIEQLDVSAEGKVFVLSQEGASLLLSQGSRIQFVEENDRPLHDVLFASPSKILIGTSSEILESNDEGQSWLSQAKFNGRYLYRTANGTMFTYPHLRLARTLDEGKNWTPVNDVDGMVTSMSGNDQAVYAIASNGSIYSSLDQGATWSDPPVNTTPVKLVETSATTTDGTLVCGYGFIDTTESGAAIWISYRHGDAEVVLHNLPCNRVNTTYRFAADALGHVYLATACGLYSSDDEGENWTWLGDLPTSVNPTALQITASGDIILGTDQGLFKNGKISSVGNDALSNSDKGTVRVSVVPNPVGRKGLVSVTLQSKAFVRLALYNVLGQEIGVIAEGQYSAGEHSFSLSSLENINQGSYVVAVETDGRIVSKNVVVLPE